MNLNESQFEAGDLPKGWIRTQLGQISLIGAGGPAPQGEEYFDNGVYPFVRVQDMGNLGDRVYLKRTKDYINDKAVGKLKQFPKGSVLFTKSGMSILLNQRAILADDMFVVSHIGVSFPFDEIPSEFIYYWLKTVDFKKMTHATTLPSLRLSKVEVLPFPLAPLAEQKRIVAKIEELFTRLDAGVEALKKVKAELKRYRQAVLKYAFEGKLTEQWRKKNKDKLEPASKLLGRIAQEQEKNGTGKTKKFPSLDKSNLPELPDGWEWTTMPQVGELNRGKSRHRPRNAPHLYGGKYPFVQTGDIRNAKGVIKEYSQTYNEKGLKQSRLWPKGTLCITIAANIADTAFLGFDACIPDSIVGFKTDERYCNTKFVEFFLRTAKADLERYAPATAQKNINLAILSMIAIPFPPLLEQTQIVSEIERHFSIADEVERAIVKSLKEADRLRQSILKKAFEGKLVPQDPNDEPAEKLLERIKAKRTTLQAKPKPKRTWARKRKVDIKTERRR